TANLFHNLGNANERVGAAGLAMLNYERALVLQPSHIEARANLKFLREQSLAKMAALTWRDHVFGVLNLDGWVAMTSVMAWLAVFIIVVPLARRRRLSAGGVGGLVLALCAAGFATFAAWQAAGELNAGIIIAKQAEARLAPADRAALADVLPAGSRVRVLSVRGEWTFCELPGGGRGWVPSSAVERVRLSS
ncbi:MAG: SH3 domain-containing protein, partial [Chthoniobacteraceae bacterium]